MATVAGLGPSAWSPKCCANRSTTNSAARCGSNPESTAIPSRNGLMRVEVGVAGVAGAVRGARAEKGL